MKVRILLGPVMAGLLVAGCLPGDDGDPGRGGSGGSNSDNGGSGGSNEGNSGTGGNGAPGTCDEATAALDDCMSKACDPARAAVEACLERIFAACQGGNGGGGNNNEGCDQGGGFASCDPDGCQVGNDESITCPDGLASDCAVRDRTVACPDGRICTVDDAGLIHCDGDGQRDPGDECDPLTACAAELQAAGTCGDACATEADDQQRLCGGVGG